MGEPPGTVALIEPDPAGEVGDVGEGAAPAMDAHSMNPVVVLQMLAAMGGQVGRVVVVGCQPSVIDEGMGLSPAVEAAVQRGVDAVHEVLTELCVPNEERSRA
jgi:hydrogenase maturation protease